MRFRNIIANSVLLLLVGNHPVFAKNNPSLESVASIETKAMELYSNGQYRPAIEYFRELRQFFQKEKDHELFIEASILLAYSQEALGVPIEACFTLRQLIDANPYLCSPSRPRSDELISNRLEVPNTKNKVIATLSLANIVRDFGLFRESETLLNLAARGANQINDESLMAGIHIGSGNLKFVELKIQRDRLIYQGDRNISADRTLKSKTSILNAYEDYESAFDSTLDRDAVLKWVLLHHEHQKWLPLLNSDELYQSKNRKYRELINKLRNYDLSDMSAIEKAQFKLELSSQMQALGINENDNDAFSFSFGLAQEAISIADKIDNGQLLSKAYGQIGSLYDLSGQYRLSLKSYTNASRYAYRVDNASLYKWQYEIAKLWQKQGDIEKAASFYEASISNLREVEWNIAPTSSEIRINFQESTKPIFDDFLELLLENDDKDFGKILNVQKQLTRSELQNYLGCGSLQSITSAEIFDKNNDVAIINILQSGKKYYIIFQQGRSFQSFSTDVTQVNSILEQTEILIDSGQTLSSKLLKYNLAQLYTLLIEPIDSEFILDQTLLFSLDSNFQQIPIGLFFDGDRYLIQKNPVALIGPQLYSPRSLTDKDIDSVFFAGISEPNSEKFDGFSQLPFIEAEANSIDPKSKVINSGFTQRRLLDELAQANPIVHIASHGQFSSDPKETFLLAWDQKINLDSLASVVGDRAQNTPNPIELLVLSACETAKGDKRAALGMAGITVQAGARSTLASLWRSQDESSAILMEDFYKFLRAGHGKAKALQLAQIKQIEEGRSPYDWGNFVLVGSWL